MNGMTLKQMAASQFYAALDAYRTALQTGKGIVAASVAVHSARRNRADSTVVNRVFRETRRVAA